MSKGYIKKEFIQESCYIIKITSDALLKEITTQSELYEKFYVVWKDIPVEFRLGKLSKI